MPSRYELVVGVLAASMFVVTSAALAQNAQKKFAPAFPRDGVTQLQEQPSVIFWEVILEKGHPSPMYELPLDQVSIGVTEGSVKYTRPDGAVRIDQVRVGDVKFESKGTVLQEEGMSEVPGRQIIIQLKDGAPAKWPVTTGVGGQFPRLDAVKLFENDRINVWDQTWMPNRPVTNHLHYNHTVAVFVSAGKLHVRELNKPYGAPVDKALGYLLGEVGPIKVPHEEEWVEGTPRAIWVEFK